MKRFLFLASAIVLIVVVIWGGNYLLSGVGDDKKNDNPNLDGGQVISVLPGGGVGTTGGSVGGAIDGTSRNNSSSVDQVAAFPLTPQNGFGVIIDREVKDYVVDKDGSIIFIQKSGQVMHVASEGADILSSVSISNLRYASISDDAQKIVVVFGSEAAPQVSIFDIKEKSWEPLFIYPESWPVWAPNNYRLAYITRDKDISALEVIDVASANPTAQRLASLDMFDIEAFWKNSGEIIISQRATAFAKQDAFVFNIARRSLISLFVDEPGLVYLWYPLIDQGVVFTSASSLRGGLFDLVDASGKRSRRFSFVALPRDKCTFMQLPNFNIDPNEVKDVDLAEASLICALPRNDSGYSNYNVPDDYWQGRVDVSERIVKVSLENGTYETVSKNTQGLFDAIKIKVGNDALYFINRTDGRIYGFDFATH
jgi:hypothetical protein